jgi:hypothetical protein
MANGFLICFPLKLKSDIWKTLAASTYSAGTQGLSGPLLWRLTLLKI